jgi:hypothetical protein
MYKITATLQEQKDSQNTNTRGLSKGKGCSIRIVKRLWRSVVAPESDNFDAAQRSSHHFRAISGIFPWHTAHLTNPDGCASGSIA